MFCFSFALNNISLINGILNTTSNSPKHSAHNPKQAWLLLHSYLSVGFCRGSTAEGRITRVEGRENDINFLGRVLFSNQVQSRIRLLTHRETFQQSFIHSFVINQYDDAELKMYFKHERSNSSCSNRWLGIACIVEIIRLVTLKRLRTAFIMYVNSLNKKNRVGS